MNKKKDPEKVRCHQRTVWLTNQEVKEFSERVRMANMKEPDFIREMITKGYVVEKKSREERILRLDLLTLLIEYRTNFNRISNLIKFKDEGMLPEVVYVVRSIQKLIDDI